MSARPGYTLIEFLVVIGILVLAVGSILAFLTSSLKGSNQANVTIEVKQNGQAILDALERSIRKANSAAAITGTDLPIDSQTGVRASSGVNLAITNENSIYIACFDHVSSPAANGWIGVANVANGTLTSTASNYKAVSNTDVTSGVDIYDSTAPIDNPTGCKISVISQSDPDIVSIAFTANQGVGAPSRKDFSANAKFQTTISLRQY